MIVLVIHLPRHRIAVPSGEMSRVPFAYYIAIVSALIWSCCEAGFLKTYLHKYFYSNFPSFVQTKLFIHDIVGISMRNIALLSIYILFSLYEEAVREEKSMKKESAKQLQLLKVKDNQKKDCFIEIAIE